MKIYRDKVLQVEGEDYTVVDNVVIFKKPFTPAPKFLQRGDLFFPVIQEDQSQCGSFYKFGEPVKDLPEKHQLIPDQESPKPPKPMPVKPEPYASLG